MLIRAVFSSCVTWIETECVWKLVKDLNLHLCCIDICWQTAPNTNMSFKKPGRQNIFLIIVNWEQTVLTKADLCCILLYFHPSTNFLPLFVLRHDAKRGKMATLPCLFMHIVSITWKISEGPAYLVLMYDPHVMSIATKDHQVTWFAFFVSLAPSQQTGATASLLWTNIQLIRLLLHHWSTTVWDSALLI